MWAGGYKRSVSWVSEPLHEEVTLNNKDAPKIPVHGHWVPVDVLERRASFQGTVFELTSSFHTSRDRVKSLPIPGDKEFTGEWTKYQ